MKLTITIDMDNAAFAGGNAAETARILTKLAKVIGRHENINGKFDLPLQDINGQKVGEVKVTSDTIVSLALIGPEGEEVIANFDEADNEKPVDLLIKADSNIHDRYPDYRWLANRQRLSGYLYCDKPAACYDFLRAEGYKAASDEEYWLEKGYHPA